MAEKEAGMHQHEQRFVWVKDKAGNEYVCRVMDLQDPKNISEDDLKNCRASLTLISRMSFIVIWLYLSCRACLLYLFPLHSSQGTSISSRKCMSYLISPNPLHFSHLPFELKDKSCCEQLTFWANSRLIKSKRPV